MASPVFLRAEWRKLVMFNYRIDPSILIPYLPAKTVPDLYNGECIVSLVGFQFLNTSLLGIRIPFHGMFEEFNLRFYVKHFDGTSWKRGTVFISEIVPKFAIPLVANNLYREHYVRYPMRSGLAIEKDALEVSYGFNIKNNWNDVRVKASPNAVPLAQSGIEEFITEHYWGYNRWDAHTTLEYAVEHEPWNCYPVISSDVNCRFEDIYPAPFHEFLYHDPYNVLLAEGSPVLVRKGVLL